MAEVFRPEPTVRIVERSPVLLRAPRAAPRRMALTLLAGLGILWVPMTFAREYAIALGIAAMPLALFLTTARGANTLRADPKKETLTLRRHYLFWSRLLGRASYGDVEGVSVDRRFVRAMEESPLTGVAALLATLGIHAHFGGRAVTVPVWDLVLRLRTTQVLVVITTDERECLDKAAALLRERLKLPAPAG